MAKTPTKTVRVDKDLEARLRAEASKVGVGWTTLLIMLAREALAVREAAR